MMHKAVVLVITGNCVNQLCPTEIACWAKNYVTILTRATY